MYTYARGTSRHTAIHPKTTLTPQQPPKNSSFKRYHMEHHKYQGDETVDVDLPTEAEGKIFRSRPMKLLFVFLMPAFYSLRCVRTEGRGGGGLKGWCV